MLMNTIQSDRTRSSDYARSEGKNQLDKRTDRYLGINLSNHDLLDRRPTPRALRVLCSWKLRTMKLDLLSVQKEGGEDAIPIEASLRETIASRTIARFQE